MSTTKQSTISFSRLVGQFWNLAPTQCLILKSVGWCIHCAKGFDFDGGQLLPLKGSSWPYELPNEKKIVANTSIRLIYNQFLNQKYIRWFFDIKVFINL